MTKRARSSGAAASAARRVKFLMSAKLLIAVLSASAARRIARHFEKNFAPIRAGASAGDLAA